MPDERMIPLDQIGYDPKYYPRVNGYEDWFTVNRYRDALLASARMQFPPITLVRATAKKYPYLLIDGRHRCRAYTGAERTEIPAVIERLPESRWFARSVELNAKHGRNLDPRDKAWIAVRLEKDGYTINDAAALLQMRVESLEKLKSNRLVKINSGVGKKRTAAMIEDHSVKQVGGSVFGVLKAPFVEFAGTRSAVDALEAQAPLAARDVLHVLDSTIAVLSVGVDMTDAEVAERVQRIRKLLDH